MYAAVRVRGMVDKSYKLSRTMEEIGLGKKNRVVLLPELESIDGKLKKVKDIITFGKVSPEFIEEFLTEKLETPFEDVLEELGADSVEELVEMIDENEVSLSELREKGFSNVFDMNSPKKGYKNTKRQFKQSGSLGFREGNEIENLIKRM